jgi:predicted MFS family arabinose efflux permease
VPRPTDSAAYARYVLGVLFAVSVVNFVDRQILSILLEPIKAELHASDTAMGFLTGIAFALFYTVAGIPIARIADRGSRRTVIAVGLTAWSAMTAASGLARSYGQLALARVGVGVGEAASGPAAHSLLADYFPPARRATALAVYAMGIHVGILIGFVVGGWVSQLWGWRAAFFVVGAPGLVLAVVVQATVREPPRHVAHGPGVSNADAIRAFWRMRSLRHMALGAALHSFAAYGIAAWAPAFLGRVHHMQPGAIGTWLGLLTGVGGICGALLGGTIADRMGARDARWYLWAPALASVAEVPFWFAFLLWDKPVPAMLMGFPGIVGGAMWLGPVFATTQTLVRPEMRALASALLLFVINLIGLGLGPQAVGVLNDVLSGRFGTDAIRYSLLVVGVMNVWAAAHFVLAARTVRADLATPGRSAAA